MPTTWDTSHGYPYQPLPGFSAQQETGSLIANVPANPAAAAAVAGVKATLRRGYRSACIALLGDSTGDGKLVGVGSPIDEWPQVLTKTLQRNYPTYTLLERRWNDTNQAYDMPIKWADGVGNGVSGTGDRNAVFNKNTPGQLTYAGTAVTGDIDVRVRILPTTWTPSGDQAIVAKWTTGTADRSWLFLLKANGALGFNSSADGTTNVGEKDSTNLVSGATGFVAGQPFWVRATLVVASGNVLFYTSPDGVTWTQLGTTITGTVTSIFAGTAPYQMGSFTSGFTSPFDGKIYWTSVTAGINNNQNLVPVLPDDWELLSTNGTVNFSGAPVLMLLNASTSGQNVAYFDNAGRRPLINQPHGQLVIFLSSGHNDNQQNRQTWITNYAAWVSNIKTLVPGVPIVVMGQNPVGLGGSFSFVQQDIELRASRGAILQAWAASQAGVYAFDAWPLLSASQTIDQLHPTTGPNSGSDSWGNAMFSGLFSGTA